MIPNDPLTDEDADHVVLMANAMGTTDKIAAQHFFMSLPTTHSALRDHMGRWEFQIKIGEARKKLDSEYKKAHS